MTSAPSPPTRHYNHLMLWLICLVAAMGGLLFGYDTAVVAGAIGFLTAHFELSAELTGWLPELPASYLEPLRAAYLWLIAIATPGPFFFLGEVPDELKQATEQMQLGGEFATHTAGFDR